MDFVSFLEEHAAGNFRGRDRDLVGNVDGSDIAGHEGLSDNLLRGNLFADLNEHIAGDWKNPSTGMQRLPAYL
jgi:hypothetical protein